MSLALHVNLAVCGKNMKITLMCLVSEFDCKHVVGNVCSNNRPCPRKREEVEMMLLYMISDIREEGLAAKLYSDTGLGLYEENLRCPLVASRYREIRRNFWYR